MEMWKDKVCPKNNDRRCKKWADPIDMEFSGGIFVGLNVPRLSSLNLSVIDTKGRE